MPLYDEAIINARLEEKKKLFDTLMSGMYIENEFVEFEQRDFFDSQMSIIVPKSFDIMSIEVARIKFPREQRPQIILCNNAADVSLGFSYFNTQITNADMPSAIDGFLAVICKVNPAVVVYEKNIESLGNVDLGWFDIKSYAIDGQVYGLTFITSIAKKCFMGWFNCPFDQATEWKPAVHKMILSIKDQTKLGGV